MWPSYRQPWLCRFVSVMPWHAPKKAVHGPPPYYSALRFFQSPMVFCEPGRRWYWCPGRRWCWALHSHVFSRPQLTIHLCLYCQFNQRETSWSNAGDSTSTNILRGSLTTSTISKTKAVASSQCRWPPQSPVLWSGPLYQAQVPSRRMGLRSSQKPVGYPQ